MSVESIYYDKIQKLESKLKMMEISFEQINNSRNDLIKQLADCEMLNEQLNHKLKLEELINESIDDELFNFKQKLEEIKKEIDMVSLQSNSYEYVKSNDRLKKILGDKTNDCLK